MHDCVDSNNLKQNQKQVLFVENQKRFFELHIDVLQQIEVNHFLLRVFDVTEERKAERISNNREKKYKILLEKNVAGVFSIDENGKMIEFNDTLRFLLLNNGLKESGIPNIFSYCDTSWTDFEKRISLNKSNNLHHLSFKLPYNIVYLLVRIQFEELTQRYEGTAIDVSEIEQIKREKEEKEEHYQLIFQESNDAIFHTQNGLILSANKSAEILSGLKEKEMLGQNMWDFFITNLGKETLESYYVSKKKFFLEGFWLSSESSILAELSVNSYTKNNVVFEQTIVRDISVRKKYEESLVKNQTSLQGILDNIPESIFVLKEEKIVFTNKQAENSFPGENASIDKVFSKNEELRQKIQLFIETRQTQIGQITLGPSVLTQYTITSTPYFDEDHILLVLKDVTLLAKLQNEQARADLAEKISKELKLEIESRKKAEQILENQTTRLTTIIESASNTLIWMVDNENKISSFNSHFKTLMLRFLPNDFEFKEGVDLMKVLSYGMTAEGMKETSEILKKAQKGIINQTEGIIIINKKHHWFETFISPILDTKGKLKEISFVAHDITEKKNKNKELVSSLNEKEILLKEVHHRVKNNLQVISSILNLQSSYVTDDTTLKILKESQNRIKSMSFIHENLYQTKDFSSINFSDYIRNLSQNLFQSHKVFSNSIKLITDVQYNHLDLDKAIPCGLIINELLSNALKYAFDENQEGEIRISFIKKNKTLFFEISDNGKGLPKDFNIENSETLGLQLVTALVEQLNGNLELKTGKGTNYLITFES